MFTVNEKISISVSIKMLHMLHTQFVFTRKYFLAKKKKREEE